MAQLPTNDKVLDLNYTASYGNSLSLRLSSRLSESQNWHLRGFNAESIYGINGKHNQFAITFGLTRGYELNARTTTRYGLTYNSQSEFANFSISLYQTEGTNCSGLSGRIDINMKFK